MIQRQQVQVLQIARRQVKLSEEQYRTLLRNIAGVESSRDQKFTQAAFEDVMAVLEDMGFKASFGSTSHFRDKVAKRGTACNERIVHKINELSRAQSRYPLSALCLRFSDGRTENAGKLRPYEGHNLIEMLKDVIERESS